VHPQAAAAKAAADAIADIEIGGLGEQCALPFARRAIDALNKVEQFTDQPRRGEVIYQFAVQAAQAINRFGTPQARELAEQLSDIAQRQQLSQPTDLDKVNQIDRLLRSGQYQQALALTRRVRAQNPTAYREVMFDNFETIANLRLHNFAAASTSLQRILMQPAKVITCDLISHSPLTKSGLHWRRPEPPGRVVHNA
jgi:uncharacterized protein YaaN involved in tellurite resistance